MKDVNLKAFNWINDSKTIGKHIFCGYTCEFGGGKCNSKPKWNNDKCQFECKTQYTWRRLCMKPDLCAGEYGQDCNTDEYLKDCTY